MHPENTPSPNWGLTDDAPKDKIRPRPRGFAAMDREQVRAISSKGGKAAHEKGVAHRWTSEEASSAGRKGGLATQRRKRETLPAPAPDDATDLTA